MILSLRLFLLLSQLSANQISSTKRNQLNTFTKVQFKSLMNMYKVITLVWVSQRNYFENATTCKKRTLKMRVATQLESLIHMVQETKTFFFVKLSLRFFCSILRFVHTAGKNLSKTSFFSSSDSELIRVPIHKFRTEKKMLYSHIEIAKSN